MKTTLLIAFSLFTFSAFAQNNEPPGDDWGERYFHFGLNFTPGIYWTSPNSSNNSANGSAFGYGYGANLEFYFTRNYAILTGFEITNIGAKYIYTSPNPPAGYSDSTITHDETVQYLQIPFQLKLKTSPFGRMRYYGLVGFDFGFRLKATDDYTTDLTTNRLPPYINPSGNNVDISGQTDFFRASLVIGLGGEYELAGSTALQASLTYNNCFTNLNNTSSNAVNIKGIELMVGVLF